MSSIVYDYIEEYIRSMLPQNDTLLKEIEAFAEENHVPIVQPDVGKLLTFLIKLKGVKDILEVGTAIGYSAILMYKAADNCRIVTVERDKTMYDRACNYINKAGFTKGINIINDEADAALSNMSDKFDLIFLDAAKGQYLDFYPHCHRMLKNGGIIFADNVLFRGMVASNELLVRRKITIVKRMRKYLEFMSGNTKYDTSIIPIGDGVSVSLKIGV